MSVKDSSKSVCILTAVIAVLSVLFTTVAILQFIWTRELQTKYEKSQRELVQLKTECFKYSLQEGFDAVLSLNDKGPEVVDGGQGRHKRDLQQLLTDMMVKQEQILLSHCLNGSKLCTPGPKGEPGFKGDAGGPGLPGAPGSPGIPGTKGDMGSMGLNGTKGDMGPTGDKGEPGTNGLKGDPGLKGDKGALGPKGESGLDGLKGDPGLKGEKGDTGLQGPPGQQGLQGLKGEKGDQGLTGTQGVQGPPGPQGPPGVQLQKDCLCIKPPTIDVFEPQNETIYYRLGSSIRLVCDSNTTDPTPTVSWATPLKSSCANKTGSTFQINSLQPSEVGNYTCAVSNQYGSATKTFVIKSEGPEAISCDFDNNNMCLWQTNRSSLGTWSVHSGQTPTDNTGPDNDHTKGNAAGYYAYIESSFDNTGDLGFLTSPELPPSAEACFTFWYNMHGNQIGSLTLETVEILSDCSERTQVRLPLDGDQGNVWHQAQINLPAIGNPYRIVLKSTKGPGSLGDSAVDDLHYSLGKCQSSMKLNGQQEVYITVPANSPIDLICDITGTPPPTFAWSKLNSCGGIYQNTTGSLLHETDHATSGDSGTYICTAQNGQGSNITKTFHVTVNTTGYDKSCNFDNGDICAWTQSKTDTFDWTIQAGPTQSDQTGPDNDHTLGNANGKYIYIETSSPRVQDEGADLISHNLPANQTKCFDFWYYMYGAETGDLKVSIQDSCTKQRREVFKESGDKGQQWRHAFVSIPKDYVPNDYRIIVTGVVGSSYHGDTGIDDLYIRDSTCAAATSDCDFTNDLCQWTQSTTDDFDWTRLSGTTTSSNTGPSGDHTSPNGLGYYLYTEGSKPQTQGMKADLMSPTLPAGEDFCLSLATNMYGDTMGSIEILVAEASQPGTTTTVASFSTADTVEQWRQQSVNIPAQKQGFHIVIRGIIGSGHASDAAIDDVSIHSGKC